MIAVILLTLAILLIFAIVGYPLFLAAVCRRAAPAVRKDPRYRTSVSVILAVHNGEEFIRAKLESLLALNYPADLLEILVVSDGSTDRTDAIVESFAPRGVHLLRAPKAGKAAALNRGFQHARGELLFLSDVRQTLDADALSHLVANFADPSVGAVTGELRILSPDRTGEQADLELYWRYELWVRRRHSTIDSVFNTTGCIYCIRRALVSAIPPDTLADDAVIPLRAFLLGYRVIFEPAALAFDYPTANGGEFRRRLRTLAGMWQVYARMPELFSGANRMRAHFLLHKFGRLILPWAMLVAFAATLALPASILRNVLLGGELSLPLLAVVDLAVRPGRLLKRITSPARTALAMNAAALLALTVFFIRPETLWRPTRVRVSQLAR